MEIIKFSHVAASFYNGFHFLLNLFGFFIQFNLQPFNKEYVRFKWLIISCWECHLCLINRGNVILSVCHIWVKSLWWKSKYLCEVSMMFGWKPCCFTCMSCIGSKNVCGFLSLEMCMVWHGPCFLVEVWDLMKIGMMSKDVWKCT